MRTRSLIAILVFAFAAKSAAVENELDQPTDGNDDDLKIGSNAEWITGVEEWHEKNTHLNTSNILLQYEGRNELGKFSNDIVPVSADDNESFNESSTGFLVGVNSSVSISEDHLELESGEYGIRKGGWGKKKGNCKKGGQKGKGNKKGKEKKSQGKKKGNGKKGHQKKGHNKKGHGKGGKGGKANDGHKQAHSEHKEENQKKIIIITEGAHEVKSGQLEIESFLDEHNGNQTNINTDNNANNIFF